MRIINGVDEISGVNVVLKANEFSKVGLKLYSSYTKLKWKMYLNPVKIQNLVCLSHQIFTEFSLFFSD